MAITRAQQARQMYKEGSMEPVKQAGVMNYMPSEMVTVPKIAKSSPDTPTAKLAYITPEEQNILIDLNLYGSLDGKPNRGPGGIPSLEGDFGPGGTGAYSEEGTGRDVSVDKEGRTVIGGDVNQGVDVRKARSEAAAKAKAEAEARARSLENDRKRRERRKRALKKQQLFKNISLRNKLMLDPTIRTLDDNLVDIGAIDNQGLTIGGVKVPSFITGATSAFTVDPSTKYFDEDSIREIGSVLSKSKTGITKSQADTLRDIREDITMRDRILDPDDTVTQSEFDEYINRNKIENIGGEGENISDPCKGPNPPAYCFIGDKADDTQEAVVTRNLAGLSPRIGGSMFDFTGMADGGIADMDREAFLLGGIAKGLKKAVRGVKKLAKSPIGKAALLASPFLLKKGLFSSLIGQKAMTQAPFAGGTGLMGLFEKGLKFAKANPFKTIGGISLLSGLMTAKQDDDDEFDLASYYAQNQLEPSQSIRGMGSEFDFYGGPRMRVADGGRMEYDEAGAVMSKEDMEKMAKSPLYKGFKTMYGVSPDMARDNKEYEGKFKQFEQLFKKGYQEGGDVEPVAKKTMPLLDMDGKEKDYRETGGFVDMGRMERADDVPARLSKNEFVFTADAVRNAGEGDIDKGAEVMYNMMKNLEAGGEVSEESQGLDGAREMFQTSQRLGEVI